MAQGKPHLTISPAAGWRTGLLVSLVLGVAGIGLMFGGEDFAPEAMMDPIEVLQRRIDAGEIELGFNGPSGYLESLLKALEISPRSQTFVFSKTSFQAPLISPSTPRALYFNDDVYLGWVQDGPVVEIASVHPKYGPLFYTLEQDPDSRPRFKQETVRCVSCHLPARADIPVPRLFVMSILPNRAGSAVGPYVLMTTDRSPLRERWGGWYVTGTRGDQFHRGNMLVGGAVQEDGAQQARGRHVSDLSGRFDVSPYRNSESDVVALALLAHQSDLHNLIGEAGYAVRNALQVEKERPGGGPQGTHTRRTL